MPTYSYACTECDNRFDVQQAFTDDALTSCPACSGRLRKLFGNVGVVFKGSGFYRTDARTEKSKGSRSGTTPSEGSAPAEGTKAPASSPAPAGASASGAGSSGGSDKASTSSAASSTTSSTTSPKAAAS